MPLSQTNQIEGMASVGRYFFIQDAIIFGREALSVHQNMDMQIIFIDEIGAWELQGQGWGTCLNDLIINCEMPLILSVRKKFLELVVESWVLQNPLVIEAKGASEDESFKTIMQFTCLKTLESTNH